MTDHAELNARAARLAGWRYLDDDTNPHWYHPLRLYAPLNAPDYCASLDLIRRDLLPLLDKANTEYGSAVCAFAARLWRTIPLNDENPWGWQYYMLLTAPPEVIVRAILEVLNG